MNKKAIVLGASGLVGSNLINQLCDNEHFNEVVSITRRPERHQSAKVVNHVIDFERLNDFGFAFEGDLLFSCLGTTVKQAGSIAAQRRVDLDYQLDAAKLAAEHGVSHYFLVSSSGANAKNFSPYLKMKGQLEEAVVTLGFKSVTILQPSLLLGDRPEPRAAEGLASIALPLICRLPGLQRFRPIHGWQVAKKMIELSLTDRSGVQTLNLNKVFPSG